MIIEFAEDRITSKLTVGDVIQTEGGIKGIVIEDFGMILNTSHSPVFRDTLSLDTKYTRIAKIQEFRVQLHNPGSESPVEKIHKGTKLECGDLVITSLGEQAIVIRPEQKFCELLYLTDSTKGKHTFSTTHFLLKLASRDAYSLVL